jgi:hypothetical protein
MSDSCEYCVLSGRADHSSREVLPSVACLTAIVNPRSRGAPGPLVPVGPLVAVAPVDKKTTILLQL